MLYKYVIYLKQDLKCVKFSDSISCLSCLKKSYSCNITFFSKQKFLKFKKKKMKLCSEKKLMCQYISEAILKINHLKKQEDFLDCWEAEALHHDFNNITELKRMKAKKIEKKQFMIKFISGFLSVLDFSFFETFSLRVMF